MKTSDAASIYKYNQDRYRELVDKYSAQVDKISNLRLATFTGGAGISIYLTIVESYFYAVIIAIAFAVIFIFLIFKHQTALDEKGYYHALQNINHLSLKRLKGFWKSFSDTGQEFSDENHSYAQDLDIFGNGSLFQMINNTTTPFGRIRLAQILKEPCGSKSEIVRRQEAIKELVIKLDWRQAFQAEGMIRDKQDNPDKLLEWVQAREELYLKDWFKIGVKVLPAFTLMLILASIIFPGISYYLPGIAVALQMLLLIPGNKKRSSSLNTACSYKYSLKTYNVMLKKWEEEQFEAELLKEIKKPIVAQGPPASAQMARLESIIDFASQRYGQLYFLLNILLLWDYQCLIAMEKWKRQSGSQLDKWIQGLGEMEALSSLAVLGCDNPQWIYPTIGEETQSFRADSIAHPLLGEAGVSNDINFNNPIKILLITGSNMSGKSTLLRTAGINLVLAHIGAPVYAKSYTCSLMDIYTCMRVSDNLEKNISSFYAELLRIKIIVEAAKKGKKIFFLLDEIFKGTNSIDRHMGAKVLINELSELDACGMVSTHDLELGVLEKENPKVKNYHFEEYFTNGEIRFDYKLRSGLSKTRNAIYLMKMAGINIKEPLD